MRLYDSTLPDGSRRLIVHLDGRYRVKKDDPRLEDPEFPWKVGDPDPDWCVEQVYGYDPEPPLTGATTLEPRPGRELEMRKMTRAEIAEQQEAEVAAFAREELAARRARQDQAAAAAVDPFAGGGKRIA